MFSLSDPKADILTIRNEAENHFVKDQLVHFKDLVYFVWLGMIQSGSSEFHPLSLSKNIMYFLMIRFPLVQYASL